MKTHANTDSATDRLLDYKRKRYVFHGTPTQKLQQLIPQRASDTDSSNSFNNDTALFATKDPAAAVIFACMSDTYPGTWEIGFSKTSDAINVKIPASWKPYLDGAKGYVYVLSSESFNLETPSWQVKTHDMISPIDCIEVIFPDFEKLGGEIEWAENQ